MVRANQLLSQFHLRHRKFGRAIHQIRLLNSRIGDKESLYDRAHSRNQRSFRYVLRLQLATLEGLRNVFLEYAATLADEMDEMEERLIASGLLSEEDTDEESD